MSEPETVAAVSTTWPAGRAPRRPLWRAADAAVLPLLALLGAVLGVWSVLLVPTGPRVGGHVLSVGVVVAVLGNLVFVRVALRASTPLGGVLLLAGWAAVVLVAAGRRANGSVLLPGAGDLAVPSLVTLYGGLVAGLLAAFVRLPP